MTTEAATLQAVQETADELRRERRHRLSVIRPDSSQERR